MTKSHKSDYDRWLAEATSLAQPTNPLGVPYDVALKEAMGVASFVDLRWKPTGDLPGMSTIDKRLHKGASGDVRSIVQGVQDAQTKLLLIVDPVVVREGERARFVVDELESHIEFLLDDDIHEPADDKLTQMRDFHAQDGQRSAALAQALLDYAGLAEQLRPRLVESDASFDAALIAEAKKLAAGLLAAPPPKPNVEAAAAATRIRNGFLALLLSRVGEIRKGARHVFRRHPEIVREVTSSYERRRRAASRRAKAAKAGAAAPK